MSQPTPEIAPVGRGPTAPPQPEARSQRFFYGSLIVGLILVGLGMVAFQLLDLSGFDSRMILYAGIGVILGAFGSTATVKLKGVTVAGAGAVAVILSYLVQTWTHASYIEGMITGDVANANISVIGDQTFLGATVVQGSRTYQFRFIVPKDQLEQSTITVEVATDPDREPLAFLVPANKLEKARGSGRKLVWRLDLDQKKLFEDNTDTVLASIDDALPLPGGTHLSVPLGDAAVPAGPGLGLLGVAHAQEPIKGLLKDLESPNSTVRRNTRGLLAQAGPAEVAPMLAAYRADAGSYQTRLGVLVALTQMLRADKGRAAAVSEQLGTEDLALLVEAVAHPDRTMRIYAAEFLYDLGDPRVVTPALDLAQRTSSDEGRYLAVFVVSGAYPHLPPDRRRATACGLLALKATGVGVKTAELIDRVTGGSDACPVSEFPT